MGLPFAKKIYNGDVMGYSGGYGGEYGVYMTVCATLGCKQA